MSTKYWQHKLGPITMTSNTTFEQCISMVLEKLKAQPDLEYEATYWIGHFHLTNGQAENAKNYFLKALELSDDPLFKSLIYEQLAIATKVTDEDNVEKFFDYLMQSIEANPYKENDLLLLVDDYIQLEDYINAEKFLQRLQTVNSQNPNLLCYWGKLYENTKKDGLAEASYLEGLKSMPDNPAIYQGLGRLYFNKKEFTRSREMFTKANMQDRISAYNYYGIAISYQEENDEYRALEYYHEALKLKPDYFDVHNNLGKVYCDLMGDFKKAKEHLERAEQLASDTIDRQLVYGNLARLHKAMFDDQTSAEYTVKLFAELGFIVEFGEEDDDDV